MEFHEILKFSKDLNVLFVDDDESFSQETLEVLEMFFNKVDIAINGEDGVLKYSDYYSTNHYHYDLVISDIIMPLMDGKEFVTNIKKINDKQSIIMISASTESSILIDLIKLGVEDFLVKPIPQKSLQECIYKVSKKIYDNKLTASGTVGKGLLIPDDNEFNIY